MNSRPSTGQSQESDDCIFCKIISGAIPAPQLASNSAAVVIADIAPVAPIHFLVLPRVHVPNAIALQQSHPTDFAALFALADEVIAREGLNDYRLVFNTGAGAGQSVFHAHLHLLAGRAFEWPPG
jgi:histidine triad (HIT) family protein